MMTKKNTSSRYQLLLGDCLERMQELDDNSVDAIVTDPPYGLGAPPNMEEVLRHWLDGKNYEASGRGFMGKQWDRFVPSPVIWAQALRVLKPGGHMVAFFGARTYDMGVMAIRLAGFEVRDSIMWVYGTGFPKNMNVAKAIEKKHGEHDATPWQGFGTALKPAHEPIVLARKPLESTVADNVLAYGTGGLNIDACRVPINPDVDDKRLGGKGSWTTTQAQDQQTVTLPRGEVYSSSLGRFPANLIHDGSQDVIDAFPSAPGQQAFVGEKHGARVTVNCYGNYSGKRTDMHPRADNSSSAARFFYCAKASRADREEGLESAPDQLLAMSNQTQAQLKRGVIHKGKGGYNTAKVRKNNHPTVKPTALMAYLCRLITPPGGLILDPFMGSGSTGKAAMLEGFRFVGCELDEGYLAIAKARIEHALNQLDDHTDNLDDELQMELFT